MVKIIDIRALQGATRSGVPVYIEGFLYNFLIEKKINEHEDVILWINSAKDVLLPDFIDDYLHLPNVHLVHTKYPNKILNICCSILRWPKIDHLSPLKEKLHSINDENVELFVLDPRPAPVSKYVKKNIVVHDLSSIKFPHFFSLRSKLWFRLVRLKRELREADKIFAVSKFTESEIIGLDSSLKNKTTVQYPIILSDQTIVPLSEDFVKTISVKYNLSNKPFLFSISTLEPRKNISTLIEKFLNGDFSDYKCLVIAGSPNKRIFDSTKYKTHPSIIFTGFVSEAEKIAMYYLAEGFVCLSYYEGYGLPVKEAMDFKLPLILSDIPVFREVVGDYQDVKWINL